MFRFKRNRSSGYDSFDEASLLDRDNLPLQKTSPIFRRHSSSRGTTRRDTPSLKRATSDNVQPYHRAWSTDAHDNSPRENRAHSSRWKPSLYPPPEEDRGVGAQELELDPDYDTSPEHLKKLFRMLDINNTGSLTADEIRIGAANMGAYNDLSYIMQQTFLKGGGPDVTCDLFVERVRDNAAKMCRSEGGVPVKMVVFDYSPFAVMWSHIDTDRKPDKPPVFSASSSRSSSKDSVAEQQKEVQPPDDVAKQEVHPLEVVTATPASPGGSSVLDDVQTRSLEQFMKEPGQPPEGMVRWLAVTGLEPSLVLRLCHKYNIHPLQMEDALSPTTERLKVDKSVEGVVHVLLAKLQLRQPTPEQPSHIQREQISIFMIQETVLYIERTPSGIVEALTGRIMYAGSKIRLNKARYLVYSIVDAIVDEIFPIVQHFHQVLVGLQGKVHSESATPLETVKAIQQVNRDMNMLQFYMRPLKPAVAQLVHDLPAEGDVDLRRHLEDLLDHVVVLEEQAGRMISWSSSLNEDFLNESQHKMNQVMYLLTMVTTAFLPGQFLAGVFGMNFMYMPELQWKYGYLIFWCLILFLGAYVYRFYKRKKWL